MDTVVLDADATLEGQTRAASTTDGDTAAASSSMPKRADVDAASHAAGSGGDTDPLTDIDDATTAALELLLQLSQLAEGPHCVSIGNDEAEVVLFLDGFNLMGLIGSIAAAQ
jgi:hypothetical protein